MIENPGPWFFPPLASLITSSGRLLLAMAEARVTQKKGTYLFCDTDSLAIVASKNGGTLRIPGSSGVRILSWAQARAVANQFKSLNPYNRKIVKGSILNLVDANYVDFEPKNPQRQLSGYSIAAKRYALYEKIGAKNITIVDPKPTASDFYILRKIPRRIGTKMWPQWIYEMWDYIIRGALKLKRRFPSWLDLPQMMRLSITTYNVLKMLGEWKIARPYNFLFLPIIDPTFGYAFYTRKDEKVLLVTPFLKKQESWFDLRCVNIHTNKKYRMVDPTKEANPPHNVVFPSQFARLLIEYQEHPEAKSLAPDGSQCRADTAGILKRTNVIAGEFRYVGKESDRKWEEGDDISVLEFRTTEYGRAKKAVASEEVKRDIRDIGINKCARESGFDRKNFVRKLDRGLPVKRNSYNEFVRWLEGYKSTES